MTQVEPLVGKLALIFSSRERHNEWAQFESTLAESYRRNAETAIPAPGTVHALINEVLPGQGTVDERDELLKHAERLEATAELRRTYASLPILRRVAKAWNS